MIKNKNNNSLNAKGVNEELFLFYQVWQELVDVKTLDTYQYRINNSLNSIKEVIDVIEKRLNGLHNTNHNVFCCVEETRSIVSQDNILKKYYLPIYNCLLSHLGNKCVNENEQKVLRHQLIYAYDLIKVDYIKHLTEDLWLDITEKNKNEIVNKTNILISNCIEQGWSARALFDIVKILQGTDELLIKWSRFISKIFQENNDTYVVLIKLYFKNNASISMINMAETLDSLGIKMSNYEDLIVRFPYLDKKILKQNVKYMIIDTKGKDVYSAAANALKIISDKLNMVSFYNVIISWDIRDVVMCSINVNNQFNKLILPKDLYSTYDYLDCSTKVFSSTKTIFSNEKLLQIQNRLNGAFGYANISKASLFQEEKYMNAWVALESLARTDLYGDIVSNVLQTLPAALCLRYLYRLIRNFAEDCMRCEVNFEFTTIKVDLKQATKQKMVSEMVTIFKEDSLYQELIQKCMVNDLLEFRCNEIRKLTTDIKYARARIELHNKKISWQIQRLYRLRNEIAHSALQESTSLIVYIEHLYDYLSTFVSEIVTCVEDKKLQSLEQAYMIIQDNYNQFMELTKGKNSSVLVSEILKTGIIDLV